MCLGGGYKFAVSKWRGQAGTGRRTTVWALRFEPHCPAVVAAEAWILILAFCFDMYCEYVISSKRLQQLRWFSMLWQKRRSGGDLSVPVCSRTGIRQLEWSGLGWRERKQARVYRRGTALVARRGVGVGVVVAISAMYCY